MAMRVQPPRVGIDVSKASLDVCCGAEDPVLSIDNTPQAIKQWLDAQPAGTLCIAIEATNTYHLEFVTQAHLAGHTLYLIDGYRLSRYRDSIGQRAKTDTADARLLWRYLTHEQDSLRPWSPPPAGYATVLSLLRRRASLVQARTALQQSLAGLPGLKPSVDALFRQLRQLDRLIQKRLFQMLAHLGWQTDVARCQAIEGIGPLSAAALTLTFHRGRFKSSDAFIAFLGLDVRVRDSGRLRGRRKLTKKGDPELRRLLFLAAMQASRSETWHSFYQRYLDRGLARIQALVILARKLARVAFALLKNQSEYLPKSQENGCVQT